MEVMDVVAQAPRPVVELGCGGDRPIHDGIGVDSDFSVLRRAGTHGRTVAGDAHAVPLRTSSAGAVVARGILHHCRDIALVLREAQRCLRPGGTIVILDGTPMAVDEFEAMSEQLRRCGHAVEPRNGIAVDELERLLTAGGFTDVTASPHGWWTSGTPPFTDRVFRTPAVLWVATAR